MSIVGHLKQRRFLEQSAETGKISHAYLFSGPENLGKKTLACEWAFRLLGEAQKEYHPDLIFVEPEEKEIKIGQIRELIRKLSLKPYSAPLKVAIIDKAHLMNEEAQASLLKTLEEPKGKSIFILISEMPDRFFPTILSRVQNVKFYSVQEKEIESYLKGKGFSVEEIGKAVRSCFGRPGLAISFISDPEKLGEIQKKIKDFEKLSGSDLAIRFQYVKDLSEDDDKIKDTLDAWTYYLRSSLFLKIKEGCDNEINKLKKAIVAVQKTKTLILTTNVNSKLALETLMLEI